MRIRKGLGRIFSAAVALGIVLSLCGCSNDQDVKAAAMKKEAVAPSDNSGGGSLANPKAADGSEKK